MPCRVTSQAPTGHVPVPAVRVREDVGPPVGAVVSQVPAHAWAETGDECPSFETRLRVQWRVLAGLDDIPRAARELLEEHETSALPDLLEILDPADGLPSDRQILSYVVDYDALSGVLGKIREDQHRLWPESDLLRVGAARFLRFVKSGGMARAEAAFLDQRQGAYRLWLNRLASTFSSQVSRRYYARMRLDLVLDEVFTEDDANQMSGR